jgi:hypothetical protein
MEKLSRLLSKKIINKKMVLDEKTIFYVFKKIIEEEYGKKGLVNFIPAAYISKKIIIKCPSSSWKNELWLNKKEILKRANREMGSEEIVDLKFN